MALRSLAVCHMINPHHNICSADADPDTKEYVDVSDSDRNPVHYESIAFKVGEPMAVSHKVTDTADDFKLVENDAYSTAKDTSDEYMIENILRHHPRSILMLCSYIIAVISYYFTH